MVLDSSFPTFPLTVVRGIVLLSLCLLCAFVLGRLALGQSRQGYAAFTLVTQVTDYDPQGNATAVATETRYFSSSGDWRWMGTHVKGRVRETVFIQRRGVFFADHRNKQLVKLNDCMIANCWPHHITAQTLRSDPEFLRTEQLLGIVAYIHKNASGDLTYFAPQLGDIPFKRITFLRGYKRVEEPVSLTFGEPDAAQVRDPSYQLVEEKPVFDADLDGRALEKPSPHYSSTTLAQRSSGKVTVEVIVDESGGVVDAWCVGEFCFSVLGQAAVDAAYRARFAPKELAGKPIKVMGLITYQTATP